MKTINPGDPCHSCGGTGIQQGSVLVLEMSEPATFWAPSAKWEVKAGELTMEQATDIINAWLRGEVLTAPDGLMTVRRLERTDDGMFVVEGNRVSVGGVA